MTANQINYAKLQEDIRHNIATEGEAYRHDVEDERIRSETNAISYSNYEENVRHNVRTEAINEEHYGRMDEETARSHLAQEAEINRSNLAREAETYRTNVANEELRGEELEEKVRHEKAVEKETKRNNKAMEAIANKNAEANLSQAESAAMNARTRFQEYITEKYYKEKQVAMMNATLIIDQGKLDETIRHAMAVEKETERHNREMEQLQRDSNNMKFITTPSADSEVIVNKAKADAEYASATEKLARAGLLKTQEEWYAWNQIVNSAVNISQAVKNFSGIVPLIGGLITSK